MTKLTIVAALPMCAALAFAQNSGYQATNDNNQQNLNNENGQQLVGILVDSSCSTANIPASETSWLNNTGSANRTARINLQPPQGCSPEQPKRARPAAVRSTTTTIASSITAQPITTTRTTTEYPGAADQRGAYNNGAYDNGVRQGSPTSGSIARNDTLNNNGSAVNNNGSPVNNNRENRKLNNDSAINNNGTQNNRAYNNSGNNNGIQRDETGINQPGTTSAMNNTGVNANGTYNSQTDQTTTRRMETSSTTASDMNNTAVAPDRARARNHITGTDSMLDRTTTSAMTKAPQGAASTVNNQNQVGTQTRTERNERRNC